MTDQFDYDVIIAGGGPAGASTAIHLATGGARVLLVEKYKFPRAKLCGEFISPECARHFELLGVAEGAARGRTSHEGPLRALAAEFRHCQPGETFERLSVQGTGDSFNYAEAPDNLENATF